MDGEDALSASSSRPISSVAQAYPSYWARLALGSQRAAGAAACAVNFPAWGRMCQQLLGALEKSDAGKVGEKNDLDKALAFIKFFATPIDNLDEMAAAIIMQEEEITLSYAEISEHVRLLQGCELMFWDACYCASD